MRVGGVDAIAIGIEGARGIEGVEEGVNLIGEIETWSLEVGVTVVEMTTEGQAVTEIAETVGIGSAEMTGIGVVEILAIAMVDVVKPWRHTLSKHDHGCRHTAF